MNKLKLLFAALLCTATAAVVPVANAQTVHYLGSGSSAMFQGFEVAAVNDLAAVAGVPAAQVHHWSVKTSHSSTGGGTCTSHCAGVTDSRSAAIPVEYGNLWVVWFNNTSGVATDIWAYASVDSTVGVRTFLAGATLTFPADIGSSVADNAVSPQFLTAGAPGNGAPAACPSGFATQCDDEFLQADVITALSNHVLTAGMTDIRPEDALYATNRALGTPADTDDTLNPNTKCQVTTGTGGTCRSWALGYGPGPVGTGIKSGVPSSTSAATPVAFALPGFTDPITTTHTVPATIKVFPVGESPIIFIVNRSNTTGGLGQLQPIGFSNDGASGQSYYARNVWDQHPYPPNGTPPAPTTRRPLGNLFTGHDCSTDNAAFAWPTDTGNRIAAGSVATTTQVVLSAVNPWLREPLSGTMNTTEFTEFRRYGTTNGNGPTGNGQPALTSQEQDVDPITRPADNPLALQPCLGANVGTAAAGKRSRGIGTGQEVGGAGGVGGVQNTTDSIGYTFFSFSNISALAANVKYGYLMIDGIDPLFANYSNAFGGAGQPATANPGQPATTTTPLAWGELPACSETGAIRCNTAAIWGTNLSYPHLRDGTYPAWSELRMMCDSAVATCQTSTDPIGAEALVQHLQQDVHCAVLGGVPDFLPFNDAGTASPCSAIPWANATLAYGDASFVREHYDIAFKASQYTNGLGALTAPTTTHESNTAVDFHLEGCSGGSAPGVAVTSPPTSECGGDAGGLIVPAGSAAKNVLQ
jgi:hypothetical protein